MPTKTTTKKSTFDVLNAVNVNDRTEKKGQLTYLSWSWAWQEVKKTFPDATYTYYRDSETNLPFSYKEGVGAFCHTSVTIKEETLEMWLPVMDNRNQSVLKPTSTQINSTLMRCLTKNLAMHGMGLYIYAGEDIPQITAEEISKSNQESSAKKVKERGITEASKDVTGLEGIDLNFLPTQNMAGGGLAKEAGDESGKPPESGPTPQGLASIIKRGRKY